MPLITVKMHSGRTKEERNKLADDLFQAIQDSLGVPARAVTVDIQEVPKEEWEEKVANVEMYPRQEQLYYLRGEKKEHE